MSNLEIQLIDTAQFGVACTNDFRTLVIAIQRSKNLDEAKGLARIAQLFIEEAYEQFSQVGKR
ncbi:hypothetical protein F9L16_09840 [Agarivorans sp. B2Z047]|uniref:hypothetical protein n=1 Tax=Agarivorans sp. B2Z047 TaxID=2652721 RepID=UPI00128BF732|nr:hypothetical protein [Agarivorans sp. B2Z047]MPW29300.1 hypothetical protein [Agarivorans sp. B2Z047]UQN41853.1 hypothetical protein LQZ07_19055 [Agarivorans sp. B2Z047]